VGNETPYTDGIQQLKKGQNYKDWKAAIAGIGQGNGAGPQIWAAISTVLFKVMREDGFFAKLVCAMSRTELPLSRFSFVDDINLCLTQDPEHDMAIPIRMLQAVNHWAGILQASGGVLVPETCLWYAINFKWHKDEWHYLSNKEFPASLTVPNNTKQKIKIPRLEPSEAQRTLGVQITPDGNNEAEVEHLKNIATEWGGKIERSQLSHAMADYCLRSVTIQKLAYPLVAMTMTSAQC